jgi:hypothetical protein
MRGKGSGESDDGEEEKVMKGETMMKGEKDKRGKMVKIEEQR